MTRSDWPRHFTRSIKSNVRCFLSLSLVLSFHATRVFRASRDSCEGFWARNELGRRNEARAFDRSSVKEKEQAESVVEVGAERRGGEVREVLAKCTTALCVKLTYLRQSPRAVPVFCLGTSCDPLDLVGQACYYTGMRKRRTGPSQIEETVKNVRP